MLIYYNSTNPSKINDTEKCQSIIILQIQVKKLYRKMLIYHNSTNPSKINDTEKC